MFSPDFYPSSETVIDLMNIDCYGKVCYEPQAGSGNIVRWLTRNGAKKVLASENHPQLRQTLRATDCQVIADDFFTVTAEQISHVNVIVMNPPFSNASKHILHAWQIAPEGCEIISLCNWNTIHTKYSCDRKQLHHIVEDYGAEPVNLGSCFSTAERQTDVEVGLVRLFKPVHSAGFDFDGFYFEDEAERQENAVMQYSEIRSMVNSYVAAVKCFDRFTEISNEMNSYTAGIGFGNGFKFEVSYSDNVVNKEDFAKKLQFHCWKKVFGMMHLERYVTSGVMKDVNTFVNDRKNYPFTMRNIYRMIEIIIGTREHTMNRAIVEAVDQLTKYTDENRHALPGWKTNAGHLLNKKIIVDWIVEYSFEHWAVRYNSHNYQHVEDLTKALAYVTGTTYDVVTEIKEHMRTFSNASKGMETNRWYCTTFFEYKFFKKGTMHIRFQNEKDWELINRAYAKAKGETLPETL